MKNATQSATERLINYVMKLTPEQADKLVECMSLLKQLKDMTVNELVFADVFLKDVIRGEFVR